MPGVNAAGNAMPDQDATELCGGADYKLGTSVVIGWEQFLATRSALSELGAACGKGALKLSEISRAFGEADTVSSEIE
eukprot:334701-Rhodomonas_salina.1